MSAHIGEDIAALQGAQFTVEDKRPERSYLIVKCERCHARWSLGIKEKRIHGGNVLTLLDHAASHGDG